MARARRTVRRRNYVRNRPDMSEFPEAWHALPQGDFNHDDGTVRSGEEEAGIAFEDVVALRATDLGLKSAPRAGGSSWASCRCLREPRSGTRGTWGGSSFREGRSKTSDSPTRQSAQLPRSLRAPRRHVLGGESLCEAA